MQPHLDDIVIAPLVGGTAPVPLHLDAALDAIFFEASATREFPDAATRAGFRWRWLGSYLALDASEAFIATTTTGELAGYLVGSLTDPANSARFDGLDYFEAFAPLTSRYPAHLHINLAPRFRARGIGARLIAAFLAHLATRQVPGVHVVTGSDMRNVGFYRRNGFAVLAETTWNDRTLALLGRAVGAEP